MIEGGSRTRTGTATVLFTDLAGSTEARSRLGEETADELHRVHERILATEISNHHGIVVKTLGDGIMATFDSAANAVAAAIAIQETVRDHNADLPAPLRVRIGISAGDVAWRGNDCTGTPVIEAARLCAVAGTGEIVIADIVQAMARGRGGHAFVPLGALQLKGLSEPVPASRVRWPGDEDDTQEGLEPPAPIEPPAPAAHSRRRIALLAGTGAVAVALVAGGVALALAGGDGGDDAESSFCALAAAAPVRGDELPTEAERAAALDTLDELEAAAPNDEIRADVATIRNTIAGTAGEATPEAAAEFAAALESLDAYLSANCPGP